MRRIKGGAMFSLAAALLLAAGLSAGCAGKSGESAATIADSYAAEQSGKAEVADLNRELFAAAGTSQDTSETILGSGDLLQVSVYEAETLNTEARISSRGFITLRLLGQVKVKGLTPREAETHIEELYAGRYIKDPHVTVFVKEHRSQRMTLVGEVKNPGTYDYYSSQRLLDVLALAGGLTENAGRVVQIRRTRADAGKHGTFVVDLDELIKDGKTELNIPIYPGDVVFVPEAGVYFVDGAVRRPGEYPVRERLFLRQALVAAGGLASYADEDKLTLVRYEGRGSRRVMNLDLTEPDALETEVRDRDVIIAHSSTWGKIVHGLGLRIGTGILGFNYEVPDR